MFRMINYRAITLFAICTIVRACVSGPVAASEPAGAPSASELETIVVTATRFPQPLGEVPASVSIVERPDIQDARPTVGLEEALPRVPGVFVQSSGNFAQDARIQIRGFGTRAAFGVREVKVLVDGLPETLPDGQTQLDGVDLGVVERIEVLRGPASSLYGNAAGGVIQIFTEEAPETPAGEVRATGGSFGLAKVQVKGGGRAGRFSLFAHSSFLRLDGFRHQSEAESAIANLKLRYAVGNATDVTLLVNAVDAPTAEDPGGLQGDQARSRPASANPRNVQLDAGEGVEQGRIGAVVEHAGDPFQISGYAYILYRDFDNRLPILPADGDGIVAFHRVSPGGGLRSTWSAGLGGWRNALTVGFDAQYQDDDRRRFENSGGERGALHVKQREQVTGTGAYVREAVRPREDFEISAGVRYDTTHFSVDVAEPVSSEEEGSRTLDQWSPAAGILYTPRPWLSVFANVGTAFQVPTTTELANPDGPGFNADIEPQTAVSYEIGGRGVCGSLLSGGLSGFVVNVEDELIPFESESGRTAFRNAGRSLRYGLELDWRAEPLQGLRWTGALSLLEAEFREYRTETGVFDGNDEPGIPSWQIYQEIAYRHASGLFAAIEAFVVDGYSVDDANDAHTSTYGLVNLRAGYQHTWDRWTISPFLGLANLADAEYSGTVRLNAQASRFFEPAPGFNAYGGVALSARL